MRDDYAARVYVSLAIPTDAQSFALRAQLRLARTIWGDAANFTVTDGRVNERWRGDADHVHAEMAEQLRAEGLTILLVEKTQAQKSADTNTSKTSSVDLTDVTVLGRSVGVNTGISGSRSASVAFWPSVTGSAAALLGTSRDKASNARSEELLDAIFDAIDAS